jgi:hypothetical protein
LEYIAQHIEETELVRLFATDSMSGAAAVLVVPGNGIQFAVAGGSAPSTRGIFPLGFRWQAPTGGFAKPSGLIPTHLFHRQLNTFEIARFRIHHPFPGRLRDVGLAKPEALRDFDVMWGLFIWGAIRIASGTPHFEAARWDEHIVEAILRVNARFCRRPEFGL